jgi:hypothetical protein
VLADRREDTGTDLESVSPYPTRKPCGVRATRMEDLGYRLGLMNSDRKWRRKVLMNKNRNAEACCAAALGIRCSCEQPHFELSLHANIAIEWTRIGCRCGAVLTYPSRGTKQYTSPLPAQRPSYIRREGCETRTFTELPPYPSHPKAQPTVLVETQEEALPLPDRWQTRQQNPSCQEEKRHHW